MIDPTKYMPVLQCYKCYNVTTRGIGEGEGRVTHNNIRYARGGRGGVLQYRGDGMFRPTHKRTEPSFIQSMLSSRAKRRI